MHTLLPWFCPCYGYLWIAYAWIDTYGWLVLATLEWLPLDVYPWMATLGWLSLDVYPYMLQVARAAEDCVCLLVECCVPARQCGPVLCSHIQDSSRFPVNLAAIHALTHLVQVCASNSDVLALLPLTAPALVQVCLSVCLSCSSSAFLRSTLSVL